VLKGFKDANEAYLTLKCNNQEILSKILKMKISAFNETLNKTGVACFSRYYDNILMWSHYAKKHTGIVIGYNHDKIRNDHENLLSSDVDYRLHPEKLKTGKFAGDIKDFISNEYTTRKLFNKHPSWSYEQEYRLINSSGAGKYPIDKDYIAELYLGCNIDKSIRKAILAITLNLNIDIYDMEKSEETNLIRTNKKPAN
jgi:hypothetical protein